MTAPAQLQSCLYAGRVRHRRFTPVEHRFEYPLVMLYLDLDEADRAFEGSWLWSSTSPAVARYRRSDHFGDPRKTLGDCARELVRERLQCEVRGPVRLLTHPRYFGFVMNPVSFLYCFDEDDASPRAVIAEVNNTPWGERHLYVLDHRRDAATQRLTCRHDKAFHVSPFLPMNLRYHWELTAPGESLEVRIEDHGAGGKVFDASLEMTRRDITPAALRRALLEFPLMTWRVYAGIYFQALRLWWKGAPQFTHPSHAAAAPLSDSESKSKSVPTPRHQIEPVQR